MQIIWIPIAIVALLGNGCKDKYSGRNGEIKKVSHGNSEYVIFWEKPSEDKSDSLNVRMKWMVAGEVKSEFFVASYDKMALPEFSINYIESKKVVQVRDAFGTAFEFKCD